ncbi:MAG: hypothetical protein RRB12_07865 [Armatimonadota bacterium]|nr:hypothetical protein [Armatimonadota bacterium]
MANGDGRNDGEWRPMVLIGVLLPLTNRQSLIASRPLKAQEGIA